MNSAVPSLGVRTDPAITKVGIAIIGCGYWGMNYVRIFNELPESQVISVCDQSSDRLQEVARRFPGVYLTTQIDDAASRKGVDAVVVCTEATTHYRVTRDLLSAGHHVLVEKPLTTAVADAEELIELAEANSAILMVGHTFIFNAGIRKVKEYIQKGDGRVYYLYARRTNLGPIRRDVNALWDLAPHDIAIFNYLLDSTPEWVSAVGGKVLRNCRDDVGFISLGFPDNILAHIHVSWADPNKARELVVVKSDSRIVFNDLNGLEQVRIFEKGVSTLDQEPPNYDEFRFQIRDGDIISPRIEPNEPLKNQCKHFLECVMLRERPMSGGVEGREVVRVLEAVNRSIECKGLRVEVENNGDYAHAFDCRVAMPIRVMLADDHVLVRQGVKSLLEREKFQVVAEASDGQEALRLSESLHPDIAVIDIGMPILNGIDAARELVRSCPKTKAILLTQHEEDQYIQDALKAGVKGYVLKNQAASDLVHAIQQVSRGEFYLSPCITAGGGGGLPQC